MEIAKAFEFVNQKIFEAHGKYLTDVEKVIFEGSLQGFSYQEIAKKHGYSFDYIRGDVGRKFWKKLFQAIGKEIGKNNVRSVIEPMVMSSVSRNKVLDEELTYPEGYEPIDSKFYIPRTNIETQCFQEILKPGALVRIKAPRLMGKTSLMRRVSISTNEHQYEVVYLDFDSIEKSILRDLDKLLRWLCFKTTQAMQIENKIDEFWNLDILGSNDNCTDYFGKYILPMAETVVLLCLDGVDRIFHYQEVAEDFLCLLRSWHEKGKDLPTWENLHLMMAYATESYIPLDIHHSPFNAGFPVELEEFNDEQVRMLAQLHNMEWPDDNKSALMKLVGGHPYLVRLAMYEAATKEIDFIELLEHSQTESGIYNHHLRSLLQLLHTDAQLSLSFKQVVNSSLPVELDSIQTYKLYSMGLVRKEANSVTARCDLYRSYFRRML